MLIEEGVGGGWGWIFLDVGIMRIMEGLWRLLVWRVRIGRLSWRENLS